jgi:hypothetical protein
VLESDGLDPTTEKCVPLFQPIERCVQIRDNCLGLIGNDDRPYRDSNPPLSITGVAVEKLRYGKMSK